MWTWFFPIHKVALCKTTGCKKVTKVAILVKLRPSKILKIVPSLCRSASPFLFRAAVTPNFLKTWRTALFCNPHLSICWNIICGPPLSLHSVTHIILQVSCRQVSNQILMDWKRDGSASHGTNYSRLDHFPSPLHSIYNAPAQEDIKRVVPTKCTWATLSPQAKLPTCRCTKSAQTFSLIGFSFKFSLSFLWLWGQVAVLLNR